MGALYRRKYTILRHWLIHKSMTGFVRLKVTEVRPTIDEVSIDPVVFRSEDRIRRYSRNQYDGEYLYPKRDQPAPIG